LSGGGGKECKKSRRSEKFSAINEQLDGKSRKILLPFYDGIGLLMMSESEKENFIL
jgi:hypothetical protein